MQLWIFYTSTDLRNCLRTPSLPHAITPSSDYGRASNSVTDISATTGGPPSGRAVLSNPAAQLKIRTPLWGVLIFVFGEHFRCTSFFPNSGLRDYPANCRLLQTWNRDRGNPRNAPGDSISGHNPYGDTWVSLESADSV